MSMAVRAERDGTSAVREGFALDLMRLNAWMLKNIDGYQGPLSVQQFNGGQSNPTYKLLTPERNYVLRRQPSGPLVKGAHAVDREARVLSALGGTGFPVAHVYGLCTDDSVIGTSFYVMEMVEGRIFWDTSFPGMGGSERAAHFDAMNATIARLHQIDFEAAGLGEFGRPGNYFERQIRRWTKQYLGEAEAGRDPNMDRLIEWMPANIPADDGCALIHGDFRSDNVIFHPTEPKIIAVLDWELSTLGHPGADFAFHAMMYRMPPHIVAGLAGADLAALGIPSEEEYLAAYCRRIGWDAMPAYDFYVAFNFFRLAAIFHGIKGRFLRGNAVSAQARERVKVVPELMEIAWAQAKRAGA